MTEAQRKRQANIAYSTYKMARYTDLYSAYGRCSSRKREAWDYCQKLCEKHNGEGLRVIGRNCHTFSAGFEFTDQETGEIMFMHITKSHDTAVPVKA